MRFFIDPDAGEGRSTYDEGERALTMQALRVDVEGGAAAAAARSSSSSAQYNKLMVKMLKYNDAAHIKFKKGGWW